MRPIHLLSSVVLSGLLLAAPTVAVASGSQHFTEGDSFTDDDFCGTGEPIETSFRITGTNFLDPEQDVVLRQTAEAKFTYVNPADGTKVVVHNAGQFVLESVTETAAGRVQVMTNKGLPRQFRMAGQGVLSRDAGNLRLAMTFDEDGEIVDLRIITDRGPHPDAESGLTQFCEIMTSALGLS